jgi:AraC family transcriptional activator FtrA
MSAESGLLDGRPVATHWMHADALARAHPRVRVDPDVLYVDDDQVRMKTTPVGYRRAFRR